MKHLLTYLALTVVFSSALVAQVPSDRPAIQRTFRDLAYVPHGSNRQKLDLYLPPAGGPPRPLVIWVHGGGWEGGSKDDCPATGLLSHHYAVASIGYRFSSEAAYPAQIEDCKAAVRWLRAHAAEYGIDPARIGAWGASAGGHLVALLGTTGHIRGFDVGANLDQSSEVQCVVDWFGPADFEHWGDQPDLSLDRPDSPVAHLLGGTVATHADLARRASPVDFVKADSAPFLIFHGDRDATVPVQQSKELDEALHAAGCECKLAIVPGAGHGGASFDSPGIHAEMLAFFGRYLQNAAVPR